MRISLLVSTLIFVGTYAAIISGKIHRAIASFGGAIAMAVVGLYFGFYTQTEVVSEAIDWNTIGLLFGMMLVVGVLEDTGLFEASAVWVAKISRGRYFYLIVMFGLLTAVMSTTIDNVTTILLVAPISLSICGELGVDAKPILLTEALFSDVGGVATLVGDPPNVMISSAGGFAYMDFIRNLAPTVLICIIASIIVFKVIFVEKAEKEDSKIAEKMKSKGSLIERKPSGEIKDWDLLWKSLGVLSMIIGLFVIHRQLGLMPASVALIGAGIILFITMPDLEDILSRVKWTTLLFFAGLFVIVHGVVKTGLLAKVASGVVGFTGGNMLLSVLAILFVTAFGSAIVDNIPFTAAMLPVVGTMTTQLGIESGILWWALAFGAGMGANATYIGSSANVITVKISEDQGQPISFGYWLKYGTVIMLVTIGIAAIMLALQIVTRIHIPLLPG